MNLQKQLRCVYLHAFTSTLRFTDAVWVALLAARGFTLAQIGLAEGVFHGVSLLCEVPSGMAADLLGRRRTLIFGGALGVVSAATMAFAPSLAFICAGMGLKALGYNLLSGTTEALTYDSLKTAGRERDYIKVDAKASIFMKLASALGALASLLAGVLPRRATTLRMPRSAPSPPWPRPTWPNLSSPTNRPPARSTSYKNCPPGCVCTFLTVSTACAAAHRRGALSWPTRSSRCRPT